MIILANRFGNHSNRLFQNIHFEAFCKEYGIEYINPSFSDMHKYYKYSCKLTKGLKGVVYLNNIFFKIVKNILKKVNIIGGNIVSFDDADIQSNNVAQLLPTGKLHDIYVGGWNFRVLELTEKYQDYFIEKYTLKSKFIKSNELLDKMKQLKADGQLVIGIHIRRGDYIGWENGKYYFGDDV